MIPKYRFDFSPLSTRRIGKGTFGAKTTELDKFKTLSEKHGIMIPPHLSLPREFFLPILKRSGYLDHNEQYIPSDLSKNIKYEPHELNVLEGIFKQLKGYLVAIRSDEQSAKGVGFLIPRCFMQVILGIF
ncbi:MAG: hypothetical protein WC501_01250 [Candidatus Micrarchaeia archaeon]